MPREELVGHRITLPIARFGPPGAFLATRAGALEPGDETILLPGAEIPEGAQPGDKLEVFVYADSEGRPVATRQEPRIELGQVAFLTVTDVTRFGAFVDWGLPKELLVPFAEQTVDLVVGDRHAIGLIRDDRGRLAGTMRVAEMLADTADFDAGEWVEGEAWRKQPDLGTFIIVEREFVGLLPAGEPHGLSRGQGARFRVTHVHPDGKIELSLRAPAHEEIEKDAEALLKALARPGAPPVGDRSSPEEIRARFGLSKKAFKRAAGRLLRERKLLLDEDGYLVVALQRPRR